MCQGSTCHVVAQHGDIGKLNTALLLTWEVCATIAIRCHQDIQRDFAMPCSKKHKANQGIPTKATFVTQDSWDTTVDYPDVPMSGFQGTCPNGQPLGSPDSGPVSGSTCLSSSTACLVNRLDKTTLLTWETVHICKLTYDICFAMLEIKSQTALPRLVEQSFSGHLCLKHTDVSALNVSHILAQRGNFSRLSEALLHWDVVCR